ncbi:MAG: ribosomal-processing cysteine protease Prp [Tissierellia bacterium]|nr:ribosomal-processing cysteine protease Prp [Tissierellia bacterium]
MTKVTIYKDTDILTGFKVEGHALYDIEGKDILCAAISVLTINSINTITEILKLEDYIEYAVGEVYISLDIDTEDLDERQLRDTQVVLKGFELGVTSLLEDYSEKLNLDYREV